MTSKTMKVTYIKSKIGYPKDQGDTVRSLGFTKLNQTLELPDTPSVRGMVYKVRHLVTVEGEGQIRGSSIHGSK